MDTEQKSKWFAKNPPEVEKDQTVCAAMLSEDEQHRVQERRHEMPCETCGAEYARAMKINLDGKEHVFDSFECAITSLAPECAHCGCKIIGHGEEQANKFYCCHHCLEQGAAA